MTNSCSPEKLMKESCFAALLLYIYISQCAMYIDFIFLLIISVLCAFVSVAFKSGIYVKSLLKYWSSNVSHVWYILETRARLKTKWVFKT